MCDTIQPVRESRTIAKSFSCHAWNKDRSQVALCPNNEDILIFNTNGSNEMKAWGKFEHKLTEHGGFVSAIDWDPINNFIVTSGHDRNAYVWKPQPSGIWKPTLVILRINRAATSVKWSPNGEKFAVTSGSKCVPVCVFEESSSWYVSKMIKKHKSTVLSVAWCPDSKFIVTGSTDFKCRIFSAFIEDVDQKESLFSWSKQNSFGTCLAEFDHAKAWVQSVSWSPDSMQIAFCGHGSTIHFVTLDTEEAKASEVQTVYSRDLPNLTCDFMTDNLVVTAGFDLNPHIYTKTDIWKFDRKLDDEKTDFGSKKKSVMSAWKEQDKKGTSKKVATKILTLHENTILDVKKISDTQFSTCGVDGRIICWQL